MIVTSIGNGLTVNLNLLHIFVSVAECRSFRLASKACARSPSAISNAVRQLEQQLGIRLFYRTTRSVELTERGRQLLEISRNALADLDANLQRVHDAGRGRSKHISLACSITIAGTLLPSVVKRFSAKHPDITISVSETPLLRMAKGIADGDYDFGIGGNYPCQQALDFEHLVDDPIVALIPASMPQSRQPAITMEDLSKLPLVMMTSESITQRMFMAAAEKRGLTFHKVYDGALQPSLLLPLVDAGVGVTIFPALGALWAPYSNVKPVPVTEPEMIRKVSIITAKGARLPEATRSLFAMLRCAARKLEISGPEVRHVA